MANIVDAFVATLGLDTSEYEKGVKKYRDDRKKLFEEEDKYTSRQNDGQKRLVDGMRSLRNETAGFLLMLAGAGSFTQFIGDMISGDAVTGRFAANIGVATERVSVWENTLKRVGGSAQDAQGALRTMASAFQSLQLTGTTGNDADFQGLGVSARDLESPETALLRIAEASQRMPRAEFTGRLQRLGLTDATITLLSRGRGELERFLVEVEAAGVATDADAKAAQEFDDALAKMSQTIRSAARPAVQQLAEALTGAMDNQDAMNIALSVGVGLLGAAALAATAAYWPFAALAAVIGVVAYNWEDLKKIAGDVISGEAVKVREMTDEDRARHGSLKDGLGGMMNDIFGNGSIASVRSTGATAGQNVAGEAWAKIMGGSGSSVGSPAFDVGQGARRSGGGNAAYAEQYFLSKGFSAAQARGIVAAMNAENAGLNPSAHNRAGGGQGAYGIGQWRASRLRDLRARYGQNPSLDQQLDFFLMEMGNGDGRFVGNKIRQSSDSSAIAKLMVDEFYRPAPGAETIGDYQRAARYLRTPGSVAASRGTTNQTNTTSVGQVNIYTPASDAEGIARDIRGELSKRGLVVQAASGLRP